MPIITEKRHAPRSSRWRWIALAVALVLLSLPLAVTLIPGGITLGSHGAVAFWETGSPSIFPTALLVLAPVEPRSSFVFQWWCYHLCVF